MKGICITGANPPDLRLVLGAMEQSGAKPAKPANRDEPIDINFWHEQVIAAAAEDFEVPHAISNPGRLWEQLASDIVVANLKSKVWAWADKSSIWLLDYWLGFDPRLYFVLVVSSPQHMLAAAMEAGADAVDIVTLMGAWQLHHQELLRFYHSNPKRCLLVDAQECVENSSAFIERCNSQWKMSLLAPGNGGDYTGKQSALALHVAQLLCVAYPETTSLQHEIDTNRLRLAAVEQEADGPIALLPDQIVQDYRALRDRSAEKQLLKNTQTALTDVQVQLETAKAEYEVQRSSLASQIGQTSHEREEMLQQLHQARDALVITATEHDTSQKAMRQEMETSAQNLRAAQNQLHETTQESELLLLQLHQVQEEFEQHFLQGQELGTQLKAAQNIQDQAKSEVLAQRDAEATAKAQAIAQRDALTTEKGTLTAARDAESKGKSEALAQRDAEATAKAQAVAQRDALITEKSTLTAARDAESKGKYEAIAQRDAEATARAEAIAQRDALTKEKSALTAARDAESKGKSEVLAQRDAEEKAKSEAQAEARKSAQQLQAAQTQLKETTQESELLLLQLHQVQEELEHYFLQHQEVLKGKEEVDQRWQRMQQRMPDYCDFDAIEIVAAEANTTSWRIKNLNAVGRNWPQLEFKTTLENDTAGYLLARQPEATSLLAHWPVCAAEQPELLLIPVGTQQNGAQRLESLRQLATSDWTLLQTLTRLLLTQADFAASPAAAPGLQKLSNVLGQFPATLRFDTVSLKREQVNPDYEHLWLCLHNLSFAGKHWPEFEFRLSCAGVRPKTFGRNPKLEFPEHTGQQPFAAWFDESFDDFGAKLELRFALPDAMDMALWQRLPPADHAFIAALLGRMPAILKTLQAAGRKIKRNWEDWLTMAGEMQRVLALRTAPQAAPVAQAVPVVQAAPVAPAVAVAPAAPVPVVRKARKAK